MDRQKQINYCTFCPKLCRFVCPVALQSRRETDTPAGKYALLYLQKKGTLNFDAELASVMYQCTQCNAGRWVCDHQINNEEGIWEARRDAVVKGVEPANARSAKDFFLVFGSHQGTNLLGRLRGEIPEFFFGRQASIVYMPSCSTIVDRPQNIRDTVKILSVLYGSAFTVYDSPQQCCGYILHTLGYEEEFVENAKVVSKELSKYKQIIIGDPACVYTLRHIYPSYGLGIHAQIFHTSEFFHQHIDELVSHVGKIPEGPAAFYHDPCYLGRYLGIYDEPRVLLKTFGGGVVKEFNRRLEHTECCGGGGGYPLISPKLASKIAKTRLIQTKEHSHAYVVSACPTCEHMFSTACPEVEVKDLVNVIAENI